MDMSEEFNSNTRPRSLLTTPSRYISILIHNVAYIFYQTTSLLFFSPTVVLNKMQMVKSSFENSRIMSILAKC